jgi:hypothetical protein
MTLGYSLDPNYASLFNGSNEMSSEIIFSFQHVRAPGLGGRLSEWFAPRPSPELFPGSENQFQAERPFYDAYHPADVRKEGTWLTSFQNAGRTITWAWTSGIQNSSNYGSTGPVPRKYVDFGGAGGGAEAPDYVILRYADVLLSLAEAINKISGPTGEAYTLINQVRTRAKVPNLVSGLSQTVLSDSLYVNRRYELALEFHGIFDMRREWQFAKSRVEANLLAGRTVAQGGQNRNASPFTSSVEKVTTAHPATIDDKWRLYPIPARACELNPELAQNPGWMDGVCR